MLSSQLSAGTDGLTSERGLVIVEGLDLGVREGLEMG